VSETYKWIWETLLSFVVNFLTLKKLQRQNEVKLATAELRIFYQYKEKNTDDGAEDLYRA